MKFRSLIRIAPAVTAAIAFFGFTRPAHANNGTQVALDVDYTHTIEELGADGGGGGTIRLGYKIDMALLSLIPEAGFGWHWFDGPLEADFTQGIAGGRLHLFKIIEPGIYAHLGYGHISVGRGDGVSGLSADAGVSLDFTLLPILDLGVHAGYNGLMATDDRDAFDTWLTGVQVALIL